MKAPLLLSILVLAAVPVLADDPQPVEVAQPDAEEALVEAEPDVLFDLFYAVDDLLTADKKDEATKLILDAMEDPKYAKQKTRLATVIVRFLLFTEQPDEAKKFFLETIRTEPELARPGFEIIYSNYLNSGDSESAIAWARELLEQPLPDDMRQTATGWLLIGLLSGNQEDALFEELARLDKLPPESACVIADDLCRYTYQNEKYGVLLREIEAFSKAPYGNQESLLQTMTAYALLAKAGTGDWAGVKAGLPDALKSLQERNLQTMLSNLFAIARRNQDSDTIESIADTVLHAEACRGYNGIRNTAAREWVAVGVKRDKTCLPERIAAIRALGIAPQTVLSNISRHFYDVLDDATTIRKLIGELDAVRPLLDDDSRRNSVDSLLLDAAFIVEDYKRVLSIIEAGIPDRDEAWHNMTRTKVKAHIALQDGDIDEAVKQFRAFMDIIATSTETTPDPSSNVVYTPKMILGFNARRIGDIYAKAGRKAEADKSYAEARGYYEEALVTAKGSETEKGLGEETVQAIEKALSELP